MGFGRLLTILILIGLGYLLYKRFIAAPKSSQKSVKKDVEKTVRCAHCQLHIPINEAVSRNGRYYCSQQHLELDQQHKH